MTGESEAHALERLRERYFEDATSDDLIEIKRLARDASKNTKGEAFNDAKRVFVLYRMRFIDVVYVPRHDAIRTVLPCNAVIRIRRAAPTSP